MKLDVDTELDSIEDLKKALEALHNKIVEREGKKLDQLIEKSSKQEKEKFVEIDRELHLDDQTKQAQVNFLRIIRSENPEKPKKPKRS